MVTPPDTVACPSWCQWHEVSEFGWTHTRTLVEEPLHGLRVLLSYGGVFEDGPGETMPSLEILAAGALGGTSGGEHIVLPATPTLLAAFGQVADAASVV